MKKTFIVIFSISSITINAQNVGIDVTDPQNKLHVGGGFRLDTLTGVGGAGLLWHNPNGVVYGIKFPGNTSDVLRGDGTFGSVGTPANVWMLTGNSGTNPASHFLGTTDNQPLIFRVNNISSGMIDQINKNVLFGFKAAFSLDPASTENTIIGDSAFYASNTQSSGNTIIGYGAQAKSSGPIHYNTVIGQHAGQNNTGLWNTIIGEEAGMNNESLGNVFIGSKAGMQNTTGFGTFVGDNAGTKNITGQANAFFGTYAGLNNTTGSWNTNIGAYSLYGNTTGNYNSSTGFQSLYSNATGNENTASGANALYANTSGSFNTATGTNSLVNNTGGLSNTAMGSYSLVSNTLGIINTATGHRALQNNLTGSENVASGYFALNTNTTGSFNTAIGTYADVTTNNLTNATAIGYAAAVNASNKVRIGNTAVTVIEGQVAFTFPSDGRFKTNVSDDIKGLAFIMKLRPVSYNFQSKKYDAFINGEVRYASNVDFTESEKQRHNGFIAQEVETAAKETGYEFDGLVLPKTNKDAYGLSYSQFVVPLVKAVQEQQSIIEKQQKFIDELLKRVAALENK
jgi:hypothetical protein